MMKRILLLLVALMMVGAVAQAETLSLTLEEEKLLVVPSYSDKFAAFYSARIKNSGNAPLSLNEGVFELKDKDGNVITSNNWVNVYPTVLAPGEEAYVSQQEYPETATTVEAIASHFIDVKASTSVYKVITRVPAAAEIVLPKNPDYETRMVYATITNDSGLDLFDLTLVYVLKDDQGNLLYADSMTAYNAGVPAGGQLTVRKRFDTVLDTWLNTSEVALGTIEAFAFAEEYQ